MSLANRIIAFYRSLQPPPMPDGIEVLFPQQRAEVMRIVEKFFNKFYNDDYPRRLIFGINPGRFGAGTTGINFTAPRQLKDYCGIEHPFSPRSELSAEFIYELIAAFGGPAAFYRHYFITSVSPLGFVRNGTNVNYYESKTLEKAVRPFIISSIQNQVSFGADADQCICVGEDKNFKFLASLNEEYKFFGNIIPLPHPRFIMQYRRREKKKYIDLYLSTLNRVS